MQVEACAECCSAWPVAGPGAARVVLALVPGGCAGQLPARGGGSLRTLAGRGREFTLLRLVGTTRRQLRGMLRLEAALVITVAATLGSAIALAVLSAFAFGMTGSASPTIEPLRALTILGSAATLALAATLIPAPLRRHA